MTRLRQLDPGEMTAAQRRVYDDIIAGPRGGLGGPFAAWLHSPDLADRAQKLGEFVRFKTSLAPRLKELAILVTARFWTAQFEWWAHERFALQDGVTPEVVAAIRERRRPTFSKVDEALVYDFSVAMHEKHQIDDKLFAAATAAFGETGVVELVGILGYYTLVSMTLNTYRVPVPAGERLPLGD